MLGILTLDTAFPRIPGDLGCAATFDFPVRHAIVAGAGVDEIVHRRNDTLLPAFIAAGRALAGEGCIGITTTCGFLVRWQQELAAALPVPVLSSALLQVPLLAALLPAGRRVGIVTYSAADLTPETLATARADSSIPVQGVDPNGYFARTIAKGRRTIDPSLMEQDVVQAARRLLARSGELGALVLECANMPPYRAAVERAVNLPTYDAAELVRWFYSGLCRR